MDKMLAIVGARTVRGFTFICVLFNDLVASRIGGALFS